MTAVVVIVALVMAVGVVGTVVPLVPGILLVLAAAIGYGVVEGFGTVGVVAMAVIAALAVAGTVAGVVLPGRAAGRTGASRRSLAIGALGAVVGFFVVPVLGMPLGGAAGVYLGERARTGDRTIAWRSTTATLRAFGTAALLQLAAAIAMALTWLVWALTG